MKQEVAVWDVPTRLFHWTLVVLFAAMWLTGTQGGDWLRIHIACGEALGTLVLFRVLWGFFGSQTARFSDFVKGPAVLRRYLAGQLPEGEQPGHNPLGGLMVLLLLLVLLLQVGTGLFSADVDSYLYDGPLAHHLDSSLAESLTSVHKLWFDLILALAAVHVAAVAAHKVFKKQDLVRAMLTGRKAIDAPVVPLTFVPAWRALVLLLVAAALVAAVLLGIG